MLRFLQRLFNPFYKPTPQELIAEQLASAERDLIAADYALEHYSFHVDMLRERIRRLSGQIIKD